jgi:regulator of replication initiation timing
MNYLSSKAYVEILGEAKKDSYIYGVNKKIIKVMKNQKIEKLELENSKLEDQISELREETKTEVSSFIKKHYFPFVNEIEFDGDTYFRLYDKERNEICSLSLRKNSWEDKTPNHIVIGYYSTQVKSDNHIELDRLVTLGTVSQVIQTRSNEIIEDTRTLSMKNNNLRSKLLKQSWDIEKEISQLEKEERELKKESNLSKLFEGVDVDNCIVNVRENGCVSNTKHIKILNWTNNNKKSFKVELTSDCYEYDYDKKEYKSVERVFVYDKVRVYHLNKFINTLEEYLPKKELV